MVYFIALTLSTQHISQTLDMKQPYVEEIAKAFKLGLVFLSHERRLSSESCLFTLEETIKT